MSKAGSEVDVMMGIGGTPEGIIAAAALTCMGGAIQGRLWPRNEEERRMTAAKGYDVDKVRIGRGWGDGGVYALCAHCFGAVCIGKYTHVGAAMVAHGRCDSCVSTPPLAHNNHHAHTNIANQHSPNPPPVSPCRNTDPTHCRPVQWSGGVFRGHGCV